MSKNAIDPPFSSIVNKMSWLMELRWEWNSVRCSRVTKDMAIFNISIERFSFECRKVTGFALSTPHDWLKKCAPLFSSNQKYNQNQTSHVRHAFSRALRQLPVITSSFDWFTVFSVSFVIG